MDDKLEIFYIFGGHEHEVDLSRARQEGVCALCDNPIFLYGKGVFVDSDNLPIKNWKNIKKKYVATSCFMNLQHLLSGVLERQEDGEQQP